MRLEPVLKLCSQEQGATIASIDSNEERRWVAYFTNGVKQAASAVPNIFGTSGFSRKTRGFTDCKDRFDLLLSPSPKCSQLNKTLITTTNTSN